MFSLYAPAFPQGFLALAALVLLMVGVFSPAVVAAARVRVLTILSFFVAGGLALAAWTPGDVSEVFPRLSGPDGFMVVVDDLTVFAVLFILLFAAGGTLLADKFLSRSKRHHFEYYVLLLLATLGMTVMVSSQDLLPMYLGLELMSFCLYILAAFLRDEAKSSEAALKYFVLGSLASCVTLYGMSLLYGLTGSTGFVEIGYALDGIVSANFGGAEREMAAAATENINVQIGVIVALVFTLTGLVFKISAAPFHMWTPDVYEGSPTPVTAFMAVVPKLAAFVLLIRVLHEVLAPLQPEWQAVLSLLAVLTMAVGSLLALVQNNLKRLLAYSSIGHVGFMLVGVATADFAGLEGVLFYLVGYGVTTLGVFAALLAIQYRGVYVEKISDLSGLGAQAPWLAFALMVFMFSLAGVPPLVGFFAKFLVFSAVVEAGMLPLALFGVGFSVVAAYYALKVVKVMYFEPGHVKMEQEIPASLVFLVNLCLALVFMVGIYPTPIVQLANLAAESLF